MNTTDTFRRIRHALALNESTLIDAFAQADYSVSAEQLGAWLSDDESTGDAEISETELALFLDGLINLKRGKRDDAPTTPTDDLNNNKVLQKLRIALNLQADDTLELLRHAGIDLSKHELSALFRKAGNKHYRACPDDVLHGFLDAVRARTQHDAERPD